MNNIKSKTTRGKREFHLLYLLGFAVGLSKHTFPMDDNRVRLRLNQLNEHLQMHGASAEFTERFIKQPGEFYNGFMLQVEPFKKTGRVWPKLKSNVVDMRPTSLHAS